MQLKLRIWLLQMASCVIYTSIKVIKLSFFFYSTLIAFDRPISDQELLVVLLGTYCGRFSIISMTRSLRPRKLPDL